MGIMKTPTILSGHSSLTVNDEQAPPHKSERRPLKRMFAMLGNTPQIIPSCTYGMWMARASVDINASAPDLTGIPQRARRSQISLNYDGSSISYSFRQMCLRSLFDGEGFQTSRLCQGSD
jgi:hypothetical protein